jgi:hypothetical protein
MKKLVYTLALIFVSQIILAQTTTTYTSFSIPVSSKSRTTGGGVVTHNTGGTISSIKGSPYLDEFFLPGTIELSDGEVIENIPIRYNVNQDVIEIDNNGEILAINKPDKVRKVMYNDRVFIYNPYLIKDSKNKNAYFEEITIGKNTIYLKRTNPLKLETHNSNFGKSGTGASFYQMGLHFYVKANADEVYKLNKKNFLDHLTSHKSEMKKYIKTRKIKFDNEGDVKKLFKQYAKISN